MLRRLAPAVVCSLALAGCSLLGGDEPAGPGAAADRLAAALEERTLEGVGVTDPGAEAALAELAAPLAEVPARVEVLDVQEDEAGDRATVSLGWSWELAGDLWDHRSAATLVRDSEDPDEWLLEWDPRVLHPELGEGDELGVTTLAAPRGRVLGAGGAPIVVERAVRRYGIDKSRVTPRQALAGARRVADLLGVERKPYVEKVRAHGPEAFVEAIVLRADEGDQVPAAFADVPGALALSDDMALAPTRDFAAELLGRVGPATAEIVEESDGAVQPGDVVGLSGLQARYDEQLTGVPGVEVVARDADGEEVELHRREARPGADLVTTLDVDLQQRAEAVLDRVRGSTAALVAVQPSTGHLLAAANGPGSDLNAATFGQYAPGSTFKVATALALLRAGKRPDDPLPCPATTTVDGRTFENYDDYPPGHLGPISLRTAFAHSCNTAMIDARGALSDGALAEAAAALGLGVDHDLGFPAWFGQVPEPEGETERAAAMIGQGRVLAGPMVMATVAASVAAGRTVVPVLLPEVAPAADVAAPAKPLTPDEADQLRGLMRAVVAEGSGRLLADLPGDVGAKTGTAEFGEPGADGSPPTHAWMIAFRDDLAVAVLVQRGSSGSGTAGPLLEAFLRG